MLKVFHETINTNKGPLCLRVCFGCKWQGQPVLYVIGQTWCYGANGDTQANIKCEFEYEPAAFLMCFKWPTQEVW